MEGLTTVLDLLNSNIQLGRLSTGCTGLDQLLKGGLEYGKITELYGEAGVGKTCFILDLAVRLAAGDCNTVILETDGKLSTPRLKQIIDNFSANTSSGDSLLDRIWIRKCRSQQELISCIHLLPSFIKNKGNVKAIFVDSIAFLFRYTEDKEDQFSNPGVLYGICQNLNEIAYKNNIAVVLTNQVTAMVSGGSGEGSGLIPALGDAWRHAVPTRIHLVHLIIQDKDGDDEPGARSAVLVKSSSCKLGEAKFRITGTGISDL